MSSADPVRLELRVGFGALIGGAGADAEDRLRGGDYGADFEYEYVGCVWCAVCVTAKAGGDVRRVDTGNIVADRRSIQNVCSSEREER